MNPTVIGMIVFACSFGGALLGMWLHTALPARQVDAEAKDTVKVGIGLIATMTALVLGLVTASAKSSFDVVDRAVKQTDTDILALDRVLARYGPETAPIRKSLENAIGARMDMVWPQTNPDGSLDLQFGPKAPVGNENSSISCGFSRIDSSICTSA